MSGDEGYGADGGFGWSGSDTSRERAENESKMQKRLNEVYWSVRQRGLTGQTCGEVEVSVGLGHGAASAALSHLHKAGRLTRLTQRRGGRAQVYVHPDYVNGREEAPFRPNRANRDDYAPAPLVEKAVTDADIDNALRITGLLWSNRAVKGFLRTLGIKVQ